MLDFAKLFAYSRDIGFMTDLRGAVLSATAGSERALGYTRTELVGQNLSHLDDTGALRRFFDAREEARPRMHLGCHLRTKTGAVLTVEAMMSSLRDEADRPFGWFMAGQDLRGAVAEARESRSMLDALTDSIGAALWSLDRNGTVITWSRAAEATFGYTKEEAEGKIPAAQLFSSSEEHRRVLQTVDDAGKFSGELRLVGRDGVARPSHVSVTPLASGRLDVGYTFVSFDVSERKKAEELFRVLFEKSNDAIYLVADEDLQVVEANEAACRLTGYTREEFLRLRVPDLVPPDKRHLIAGFRQAMQQGAGYRRDRRLILRKDGNAVPTDHTVSRLEFSGRTYYLASLRDLTDAERGARELEEAKAFLEHIQENANDGLALLDDRGVYLSVNRKLLEMRGITREEIIGRPWFESPTMPEYAEAYREYWRRLMAGETVRMSTRMKGAGGRELVVDVSSAPIKRDGRTYVFAIVRDVTEQRAAEEELQKAHAELERRVEERTAALRESEERFRQMAERLRTVFYISSPNYVSTLYVSPFYEELWGRSREHLYQHPLDWVEGIHPDDRQIAEKELERCREGVKEYDAEYRIIRPDGTVRWVWDRSVRVVGPDGKVERLLGTVEDITERREAEEALRKAHAELEQRVESRTAELFQEILERKRFAADLVRTTSELQAVFQVLPDLYFRIDADGKILDYRAPKTEELFLKPEQFLGRRLVDVLPPPVNELLLAGVLRTLETKATSTVEYELPMPRGRQTYEARLLPFLDDQAIAIVRNTTERKKAETRLAAQHAATRILAEAATLEAAAPRILQAVGESLGWPLAAFWLKDPGADALRCVDVWRGPSCPGEALERASKARTFAPGMGLPGRVWESGKPAWISDVTADPNFPRAPFAREDGLQAAFGFPVRMGTQVLGVLEFFRPEYLPPDPELLAMTDSVGSQIGQFIERKRAEEALRFQKTLLESQSEAAIDGILVVSTEGRMVSFNRRFMEMWDIPADVAESRKDREALQSVLDKVVDPQEFMNRIQYLYEHPDLESREEIRLKDGRTFDRYSAPVASVEGVRYGRVWYFRDVTGRKRTEENLRGAAEETRRAYEDLKEAQAQLIRSEKLASIGMLVSGVAHEINNPLNVMYGNLQLMAEAGELLLPLAVEGARSRKTRGVATRVRRFRGMIRDALKAAQHARGILVDFRGFARDTRTAERVDLNRCLEEVLSLVQRELPSKVRLVRKLGRIPEVRCIRGQMSQVFLNLLKNAVEAIERKGTVTARTLRSSTHVIVEVADTGRGMTEEVRGKLFEPFFTTKPVGKGLGLGLSISAMIVQNHNGRITVRSRPGRGSVFRVELPNPGN